MSARPCYDPKAGEWVAYRDEPKRVPNPLSPREWVTVPGETTRHYLYSVERGTGMIGSPATCDRLDTKAEALAAARKRWPRRVKGCTIGAERIPKEA